MFQWADSETDSTLVQFSKSTSTHLSITAHISSLFSDSDTVEWSENMAVQSNDLARLTAASSKSWAAGKVCLLLYFKYILWIS